MSRTYRPSGTRGGLYSFLSDQLTCVKVEAGLRQGREPEHGRVSSVSRSNHIAFVDKLADNLSGNLQLSDQRVAAP